MKSFIAFAIFVATIVCGVAGESISKNDAIAVAKQKYSKFINSRFGVEYSAKPFRDGWIVKIQRIVDYNKKAKRPVYDIVSTHVFVSKLGKIDD